MSYQDFSPALLTLSPRLTRTGDPSASIQGINTTLLGDGAFCYCIENKGEYQLDRADNTTPPDGNLVIKPTAGPGRWFKRLPATGGAQLVIRQGTDTLTGGLDIAPPALPYRFFPRNGAGDPLSVNFPAFTAGNVLEVEAYLSSLATVTDANSIVSMDVLVSVDGGTTFYQGIPSLSLEKPVAAGFLSNGFALSSYFNVLITDPMLIYLSLSPLITTTVPLAAPPIVRLRDFSNVTLQVGGAPGPSFPGQNGELWLKAAELNPALVFQGPQGILFNIPPE